MPRRRILVISYFFPPDQTVGGARWAAMSSWLRRQGHEVTVLTTNAAGALPGEEPWTRRTSDLVGQPALRWLLRRPPASAGETGVAAKKPVPRWFTEVVVPDELLVTWALTATVQARRLVHERNIDCIVTTSPAQSTHLIPLLLGRRRPAWLADFRDGWRFEPLREAWPTRAQDRLDARLERAVARGAEVVVGVTRPIAHDFEARLGANAKYVSNGWNPELDAGLLDSVRPSLDAGVLNIVHTGQLSGPRGRDPAPLLAALRRLGEERPELAGRLRLVLAGRLQGDDERRLEPLVAQGAVQAVGQLSRDGAAALQREADALLLITSPGHASQATGKLFEYLAAHKPILALAKDNEAARIVEETGSGVTVAPDDVEGIAAALAAAAEGGLARAYAPRGLDRYVYPGPAEAVAELVEEAIARRATA